MANNDTMDEMVKQTLLRRLAARSHSGTSGRLPLVIGDTDLSFGGKYWIEVKEVGGATFEDLRNVATPTFLEQDESRVRREIRMAELLHKMIELRLIVDACYPFIDEDTGEIEDRQWPKESRRDQHDLISTKISPLLLDMLTAVINRFYRFVDDDGSDLEVEDEVIEELGNSSTPAAEQAKEEPAA